MEILEDRIVFDKIKSGSKLNRIKRFTVVERNKYEQFKGDLIKNCDDNENNTVLLF